MDFPPYKLCQGVQDLYAAASAEEKENFAEPIFSLLDHSIDSFSQLKQTDGKIPQERIAIYSSYRKNNEQIIGWQTTFASFLEQGIYEVELAVLLVHPHFRRQGIGKGLLLDSIYIASRHETYLNLTVRKSNRDMIDFLQAMQEKLEPSEIVFLSTRAVEHVQIRNINRLQDSKVQRTA